MLKTVLLGLLCLGSFHDLARADVVWDGGKYKNHAEHPADQHAAVIHVAAAVNHSEEKQWKSKDYAYPWHELYWPAQLPTWCLFLAAILAGHVALKTLNAIKAQGDLMKLAYHQWVTVTGWKSTVLRSQRGHTPNEVLVRVSIVNESSFPLTLDRAWITLTNPVHDVDTATWKKSDLILMPNQPYTIERKLCIGPSQIAVSNRGQVFPLEVDGRIEFTGILKEAAAQTLRGTLLCANAAARYTPDYAQNGDTEKKSH